MKVFIDNDIAVKLAQWGLLTRFTNHLVKQGKADLYMVSSLPYRFKLADSKKAIALVGTTAAVEQLRSFVATCKPAIGHDKAIAQSLVDVPAIDPGEATLFAAAAQYDAVLVDTGDKRALRAVGALGSNHAAVKALTGKLACLEQTVHYLVTRWTFEVVGTAIATCANADTATTRCFAAGDESVTLIALTDKISELMPHCATLLAEHPFGWVA